VSDDEDAALFLFRPAYDGAFAPPCVEDLERYGRTKCGKKLSEGRLITAAQAMVYCEDQRCFRCVPGWTSSKGIAIPGRRPGGSR